MGLKQPRQAHFIYGSIWAIRKESFVGFKTTVSPFGSIVSDSELGIRLSQSGKKVVLDHSVEVTHLKKYSFFGLLKNDFAVPFCFAQMLVRYRPALSILEQERFSHASFGQVAATALAFVSLTTLTVAFFLQSGQVLIAGIALLLLFYLYWSPFLSKVSRKGFMFLLKTVLLKPLDASVMFCGMVAGFTYSFSSKLKK